MAHAGNMERPTWSEVLDRINRQCGTNYQLDHRLSGGRQGGAWTVGEAEDPSHIAVLTWTVNAGLAARRDQTGRLVSDLVQRAYPTPAWRHWGALDGDIAFAITDLAPGNPPRGWGDVSAGAVVAAVEKQASVAGPSQGSWSDYMRWALSDPSGPRQDLACLGSAAAHLLEHADTAAHIVAGLQLPSEDAVHGDLELGNLLVDAALGMWIIDIDACGPGTRAIDYAWLYRDAAAHQAPDAAATFEAAGVAVAGPTVWGCCLAFSCLELAAFVARHGTRRQAIHELETLSPLLAQETYL